IGLPDRVTDVRELLRGERLGADVAAAILLPDLAVADDRQRAQRLEARLAAHGLRGGIDHACWRRRLRVRADDDESEREGECDEEFEFHGREYTRPFCR